MTLQNAKILLSFIKDRLSKGMEDEIIWKLANGFEISTNTNADPILGIETEENE